MSPSALPPIHDPTAIAVQRAGPARREAVRFGLVGSAQARRGDGDPARGFRDYVDTCVEAEALGFDSSFLVEHHFSDTGQVSASLDLLAWVAASKPDSIRSVAGRGCNLLLDQFASTETVGQRLALFKAECEARGRTFDPMDVAVARNLYVARDAGDTQTALTRLAQAHARIVALSQHPDGRNQSHITSYAATPGATEASALYGTPDQIAAALEALRAVGVQHVLLHAGPPTIQSLRRFSTEIMPAFVRPH